jgi:hypothetical protein
MKHWTAKRKVSFWVHVGFVSIPFGISTVSAFLLWQSLFNSGWLAFALVAVVEILSLTGLVLYIARIQSPFHVLRLALPFISVVPLCWELYQLLKHNEGWTPVVATGIVAVILIAVSHQCFTTIENLFIDPVAAAHERAAERVASMEYELAELQKRQQLVVGFFQAYANPHPQIAAPASNTFLDALLALSETPGSTEVQQVVSEDTQSNTSPPSASKSMRQMIREYKAAGMTRQQIKAAHENWNSRSVDTTYGAV